MPGTIVVGYDGTEGADAALDHALGMVRRLDDELVVVFAYKKVLIGGESADLDREVAERAQTTLAGALERASAAGVSARSQFAEGAPADVLCDIADEVDADYIVVGSYGDRPLRGVLVGASAYRLVHLSAHPVVVVRAPER